MQEPSKPRAPTLSLPEVGILVVDDRRDNRLALEALLAPLGQRVVHAHSGDAALDAVEQDRFAVILLDIRMPGLDGFETMALLKQRVGARDVPIIFLTAAGGERDSLRSYSSGAVDYLLKPIDPEALRSKVSVFVRLRQNELALENAQAELEARVAERTAELEAANRSLAREIEVRRAAEQRLYDRAFHDDLTALANRALFNVHLTRAMARTRRSAAGFAVLMMDVDRFKVVNDSLGHSGGDEVLVGVAKRLAESLREVDTIARLGGDEFAILLEGTTEVREATRLAERVLARLEPPFQVAGREVFVSVSVGVAMMSPRYERAEELVRDADVAMYRAKAAGGANVQVFDVRMHAAVREQLDLEAALRRAVDRNEMVLQYQPIVDLEAGRIDGVEALLRWRHPTRGMLPPSDFVPLCEETGLIRSIGKWVIGEACEQVSRWEQAGLPRLRMNVNVSARQFADPDLIGDVEAATRRAGIPPTGLVIELTEHAVMPATAESTLTRLRELGVGICLDDFGTGYSCLGYLRRFAVSTLKIDRSFVSRIREPDDHAIVQTITSLAGNLSLSVVAEGVETADQLARLRELGCGRAQGYLFARPLPPDELASLVRSDARW